MRARQRPLVNRCPARVHGSGPVRRSGGSATRYPLGGSGREGLRVKRVRRCLPEPPGGREGAGPLSRSGDGGGRGRWWLGESGRSCGRRAGSPTEQGCPQPRLVLFALAVPGDRAAGGRGGRSAQRRRGGMPARSSVPSSGLLSLLQTPGPLCLA